MITNDRIEEFFYEKEVYPFESRNIAKGFVTCCYVVSESFTGVIDNCMMGFNIVSPFILERLKA